MARQRRVDWYRISGAGHLTMRTTVRPYFAHVDRPAEYLERRFKQPAILKAMDAGTSRTNALLTQSDWIYITACSMRSPL
jgi:hypothetical protein